MNYLSPQCKDTYVKDAFEHDATDYAATTLVDIRRETGEVTEGGFIIDLGEGAGSLSLGTDRRILLSVPVPECTEAVEVSFERLDLCALLLSGETPPDSQKFLEHAVRIPASLAIRCGAEDESPFLLAEAVARAQAAAARSRVPFPSTATLAGVFYSTGSNAAAWKRCMNPWRALLFEGYRRGWNWYVHFTLAFSPERDRRARWVWRKDERRLVELYDRRTDERLFLVDRPSGCLADCTDIDINGRLSACRVDDEGCLRLEPADAKRLPIRKPPHLKVIIPASVEVISAPA